MDSPRPLPAFGFFLGLVTLLTSAGPARACTRPYESSERVLSRACYIFEVEVTSVGPIEDEKDAESAKARVRILRELRGRMPMKEFTLIGGPYDSCALFRQYISFTKGDRFFLFLEDEVPEETETILLFRLPRWFRGSEADVQAIIERLDAAWQRRIEIMKDLMPEAMAKAATLLAGVRYVGDLQPRALEGQPLEFLVGLRELIRDPKRPLPRPPPPATLFPDAASSMEPGAGDPSVYVAAFGRPGMISKALREALDAAHEAAPEAARALYESALRVYMTEDLLVPEALCDLFFTAVPNHRLLRSHCFPIWIVLEDDAPAAARSVEALLKLAAVMPDWLVKTLWAEEHVNPTLLRPWLEKSAATSTVRYRHLEVYFRLEIPEARPAVLRALAKNRTAYLLDEYLEYFLAIDSPGDGMAVLDVAERFLTELDAAESPRWLADLLAVANAGGAATLPHLDRLREFQ